MAYVDEQGQGRLQLQDVLSGLVEQVKQEDSLLQALHVQGDSDSMHFGAAKGLLGLQSPRKTLDRSANRSKGNKSPKKKKRKITKELDHEEYNVDTTDSSFTMTFFDQKVDLAQFTEDTPLYVMCREWMRNSSHSFGGVSGMGRSDGVYREEMVLLQAAEEDQNKAIHKLPDPTPYNRRAKHPRIPDPMPIQTGNLDHSIDKDEEIGKLKTSHLQRWKQVKKTWLDALVENQGRYSSSIDIINKSYVAPELPVEESLPI